MDWALLDDDERARAQGQRDPKARARFTAARALARRGLSALAGGPPEAWRFALDARRRPVLAPQGAPGPAGLVFSLAHCGGMVGCALAVGGRIGLDLEDASAAPDVALAAPQAFSPAERAALAGATGDARDGLLLAFWTGKEAYLKALGAGFLRDPRETTIDMTQEPARPSDPRENGPEWAIRLWREGRVHAALADELGRPILRLCAAGVNDGAA
jgi:4'-phosphopantetheinyl transferase